MLAHNRSRGAAALLILTAFGFNLQAHADCAGASVKDVQKRYANAQALDRAGKPREALGAYVAAQEYTCEANPVEAPAAKRAAAIALPLAQDAEQRKDFEAAYQLYADGGHYAASDRALMSLVRAKQDEPGVYTRAREILEYRTSPAFQSNQKVQLAVTGAYAADPKNLAEVERMPAIGAERALKAEFAAFNEQYLREFVEFTQARPEDLTDQAAVQRFGAGQQAFHQKWPNDRLKASRDALSLTQSWTSLMRDEAAAKKFAAQRMQRIEMRVGTLTRSFHRAPELLDAAIDYQRLQNVDDATKAGRVKSIREQAALLGEQAQSQQRFILASEYFRVADLDDKAGAAQEQARQLAMTKMQPDIDRMRQQAEQLQKEYSDPAKVKAMQEQAREMQKAMQAQQKANAGSNAKKADDLEKELGL